jgi:hypothetical protein
MHPSSGAYHLVFGGVWGELLREGFDPDEREHNEPRGTVLNRTADHGGQYNKYNIQYPDLVLDKVLLYADIPHRGGQDFDRPLGVGLELGLDNNNLCGSTTVYEELDKGVLKMATTISELYDDLLAGNIYDYFVKLLNDYFPFGLLFWLVGAVLFIVFYLKTKNTLYSLIVTTIYFNLINLTGLVTNAYVRMSLQYVGFALILTLGYYLYIIMRGRVVY